MNPEALLEVVGALGQLRDTLLGVVSTIAPFVQAIAPGVVQEFNQAMQDLNATIGSALIGVTEVAASVVRELGGVLLPLLQQLAPIFTAAANAVGTLLVGAVRSFMVPLELLAPVLDLVVGLLAEYAKFLADLIAVTTAVAKVFKDLVQSIFGTDTSGLKDLFKGFFDVMRQVVKALVTFAATLAVAAGAAGLVGKFADALGKEAKDRDERAGGLRAAATNPQFVDVAAIARQSQLAALTAAGGAAGREKTDTEFLKELSADLKKIAESNRGLKEALADWWDGKVLGGGGALGKAVLFFNTLHDRIVTVLDRLSRLRIF